jgi:hypothetical protein
MPRTASRKLVGVMFAAKGKKKPREGEARQVSSHENSARARKLGGGEG